jgi:hypothetical protein
MRTLALCLVLLAGTACVRTTATKLGSGQTRSPVPPDQVAVYRTFANVPGEYEEVALLNSSGEASWTNEEQMFNSMRKKAGQIGANGVVLDAVNEPSSGAKVAAAIFGVGADRRGQAIAIYVFPGTSSSTAAMGVAYPGSGDEEGWRIVRHWSGTGNLSTDRFRIAADEWRVTWTASNPGHGAYMFVSVEDGSGRPVTKGATQQGAGNGVVYVTVGQGEYFLEITAVNLSWEVVALEKAGS